MQQCCACQTFSTCTTNVVQQLRNKGSKSCSTSEFMFYDSRISLIIEYKTIYECFFNPFKLVPPWPGLGPKSTFTMSIVQVVWKCVHCFAGPTRPGRSGRGRAASVGGTVHSTKTLKIFWKMHVKFEQKFTILENFFS